MTVLVTYSTNKEIRIVSEFLAKRVNGECIEIIDLKRKKGFFNSIRNNYNAMRSTKTEIQPSSIDLSKYNLILMGSPSTLGNPSPAILTFIDNCDFKNKDVIIYTTTHTRQGHGVLNDMKKRIESRGGRIINSFIIRVNDKTEEEIIRNTLRVIYALDLDLYL
ncbi:flavodoxin family protein [Methanosphaera sp.]|jgi:hypothetical protein|uniref:flavodoxin family protein n=1 Tax=Methanosphaera sp. TaxID=2666342 RepID=UPI002A4E2FD8|nr:flavodoxin [Methanobacteriaceae archaeon]MDY2745021.1 flavodoxin [Methanosphaera sp.]